MSMREAQELENAVEHLRMAELTARSLEVQQVMVTAANLALLLAAYDRQRDGKPGEDDEIFKCRRELCEFEAYETTDFDVPGSGAEHMFLYAVKRWGREYAQKLVPLKELVEYEASEGLSGIATACELWEGKNDAK